LEQSLQRILVADDDADTRTLIVSVLEGEGYEVHSCSTGSQALRVLRRERFDLVLADIKMPRLSGIDLLLQVRRLALDTEVILMTAYASVQSAVQALRGEAFDYFIKPFSLDELRQRVHQAVRVASTREHRHSISHYLDLSIDRNARRVWVGKHEVKLTRLEFDVLACLFERLGCAVPLEVLLQEVWGHDDPDSQSPAAVKSCVFRLRKKLGDSSHRPRYISNVWGVGYQLGE
jgi:DNA-binding response OmpR family regulator